MFRPPRPLRHATLAAMTLLMAASPALAGDRVAALVYAGGEALPPEAEARLTAWTTAPGGLVSREEVRQQLAAARDEGTLAEAGEMAEPARVLLARHQANDRQTQVMLAAREAAEHARLAAIEAEAQRQAQVRAPGALLAHSGADETPQGREVLEPPVPGASRSVDVPPTAAPADGRTDLPSDAPAEPPVDRPLLAPVEVPIGRGPEGATPALVDPD